MLERPDALKKIGHMPNVLSTTSVSLLRIHFFLSTLFTTQLHLSNSHWYSPKQLFSPLLSSLSLVLPWRSKTLQDGSA
jgi:hypothetical protein